MIHEIWRNFHEIFHHPMPAVVYAEGKPFFHRFHEPGKSKVGKMITASQAPQSRLRKYPRPNVALLIETSNSYARGLLHGIRAYLREHRSWSIYLGEQRRGEPAPGWLRKWRGDGIIARIENPAIARAVLATGLPAIDVSAARHVPNIPYVETDDEAIARLAAEHLLQRQFRHFGFCGVPHFNWSCWREEQFQQAITTAGHDCQIYHPGSRARIPWEQEKEALAAWIRRLPKPVGVMAAYDIRGREVLDVCRQLSINVPEEVAVIAVDNDELLCDLADPPLSSVIPDTLRTGYEAAQLLDEMMTGQRVAPVAHLVKPLGIATRHSTDVLATNDTEFSAAARFIRAHATEGICVEDVLRAVPLSRRVLESRFKRLLGRTPHEEILRVRIERAKELLAETDLSLAAIARRTGYAHVEYLSVVFKRETGLSPSAYREHARAHGGASAFPRATGAPTH
jgi:LacI family transcriptional regulator